MIKRIAAAFMAVFFVAGCAVLEWGAQHADTARLAVKAGTLRAIEAAPVDERSERAQAIVRIAETATGHVQSDAETTIAAVESRVREEIDWKSLEVSEQLLVDALVTAIRERLEERVGDGLLSEEDRLRIRSVLDWVIEAAALYR